MTGKENHEELAGKQPPQPPQISSSVLNPPFQSSSPQKRRRSWEWAGQRRAAREGARQAVPGVPVARLPMRSQLLLPPSLSPWMAPRPSSSLMRVRPSRRQTTLTQHGRGVKRVPRPRGGRAALDRCSLSGRPSAAPTRSACTTSARTSTSSRRSGWGGRGGGAPVPVSRTKRCALVPPLITTTAAAASNRCHCRPSPSLSWPSGATAAKSRPSRWQQPR
jgi:hypothetical protein